MTVFVIPVAEWQGRRPEEKEWSSERMFAAPAYQLDLDSGKGELKLLKCSSGCGAWGGDRTGRRTDDSIFK
jgi:hypothetical protein